MRHELIEYINSEEIVQDLNDETCFKLFKLSELLSESKTGFYFPDYLLQVNLQCCSNESLKLILLFKFFNFAHSQPFSVDSGTFSANQFTGFGIEIEKYFIFHSSANLFEALFCEARVLRE